MTSVLSLRISTIIFPSKVHFPPIYIHTDILNTPEVHQAAFRIRFYIPHTNRFPPLPERIDDIHTATADVDASTPTLAAAGGRVNFTHLS